MNYKEAGVDIEKGDLFVEKIKGLIGRTYNDRVEKGAGGFAALYKISEDKLLASGTDGVGTKVKLAQELNIHDTIGIDLVAMCVNDIICTGAKPLFFLDYLACAKLNIDKHTEIVKGITEGCLQSSSALIGGETAEMPGVYNDGEYDLAGFSVGELYKKDVLMPEDIRPEMEIIALPSSGFHSNGFSLIRKLIETSSDNLKKKVLTPTKIYVEEIEKIKSSEKELGKMIYGLAHITGGGLKNILRITNGLGIDLDNPLTDNQRPSFMQEVIESSQLTNAQLYETFNMGYGMTILSDPTSKLKEVLDSQQIPFKRVGKVINDRQAINFNGKRLF